MRILILLLLSFNCFANEYVFELDVETKEVKNCVRTKSKTFEDYSWVMVHKYFQPNFCYSSKGRATNPIMMNSMKCSLYGQAKMYFWVKGWKECHEKRYVVQQIAKRQQ